MRRTTKSFTVCKTRGMGIGMLEKKNSKIDQKTKKEQKWD